MGFRKAVREKVKARVALSGPSGGGKTYTGLLIARGLAGADGRIGVIDTAEGVNKYADLTDFDVADEWTDFNPRKLLEMLRTTVPAEGYDVLVIDSLSAWWAGKGGLLEQVDAASKASRSGNAFSTGWKEWSPVQTAIYEAITTAPFHIVATMRAKMAYEVQKDDRGKSVPVKMGLAPIQREGAEYEFDILGELNTENWLTITKSRMPGLQGFQGQRVGIEFGERIREWCDGGVERPKSDDEIAAEVRAEIKALCDDDQAKAIEASRSAAQALNLGALNALDSAGWGIIRDEIAKQKQEAAA